MELSKLTYEISMKCKHFWEILETSTYFEKQQQQTYMFNMYIHTFLWLSKNFREIDFLKLRSNIVWENPDAFNVNMDKQARILLT